MIRLMLLGAISSLIATFPSAFALALLWRYPIPFADYEAGFDAALRSQGAVVFYGVMGGFVVVAFFGAIGGAISYTLFKGDGGNARIAAVCSGVPIAVALNTLMAVLDKIIGPW